MATHYEYGIIGAMDSEIEALLKLLENILIIIYYFIYYIY